MHPWSSVYHTRLEVEYAVPTASLAPRVQRGSIPGPPGATIGETRLVINLSCLHRCRYLLPLDCRYAVCADVRALAISSSRRGRSRIFRSHLGTIRLRIKVSITRTGLPKSAHPETSSRI